MWNIDIKAEIGRTNQYHASNSSKPFCVLSDFI